MSGFGFIVGARTPDLIIRRTPRRPFGIVVEAADRCIAGVPWLNDLSRVGIATLVCTASSGLPDACRPGACRGHRVWAPALGEHIVFGAKPDRVVYRVVDHVRGLESVILERIA